MKKKISMLIVCCLTAVGLMAANPVKKTVRSGELDREYLLYTPENNRAQPDGLIVCLHGFNGSMEDFFDEYPVYKVADSLNCLIVAPQALPEQDQRVIDKAALINLFAGDKLLLQSAWGCGLKVKAVMKLGGIVLLEDELNKTVDDVEFIRRIIQLTLEEFALKSDNLFLVGTSMGGYMSYQFALKQPVKLAGIVSIVGSMGLNVKGMGEGRKMSVCDFHSVTDEVVPYTGTTENSGVVISLAQPKQEVLRYWVDVNGAGAPATEEVRYYPSTNGITVEKTTWPHPEYEVVHYKMSGSNHGYFFRKESGDCMDYVEEITKFLASHASPPADGNERTPEQSPAVYPNPAGNTVYFSVANGTVSIYDFTGKEIRSASFSAGQMDVSSLKPGMYILRILSDGRTRTAKLIKR
ncbi:MAG: T9SS type A sorting domain-containing protein [Tannerella sp.]|jgi:poly(3-hydroxybutyrate) depolymerase|nr:T9SS type A sorting domain-containing protein [Tannerella sp.]